MHTKRDSTTQNYCSSVFSGIIILLFSSTDFKGRTILYNRINSSHESPTKKLSIEGRHNKSNELLNRPAPANTPDIPAAEEDLLIDCGRSTREEIRKAMKKLKNGCSRHRWHSSRSQGRSRDAKCH